MTSSEFSKDKPIICGIVLCGFILFLVYQFIDQKIGYKHVQPTFRVDRVSLLLNTNASFPETIAAEWNIIFSTYYCDPKHGILLNSSDDAFKNINITVALDYKSGKNLFFESSTSVMVNIPRFNQTQNPYVFDVTVHSELQRLNDTFNYMFPLDIDFDFTAKVVDVRHKLPEFGRYTHSSAYCCCGFTTIDFQSNKTQDVYEGGPQDTC